MVTQSTVLYVNRTVYMCVFLAENQRSSPLTSIVIRGRAGRALPGSAAPRRAAGVCGARVLPADHGRGGFLPRQRHLAPRPEARELLALWQHRAIKPVIPQGLQCGVRVLLVDRERRKPPTSVPYDANITGLHCWSVCVKSKDLRFLSARRPRVEQVKICDFGLSKDAQQHSAPISSHVGSVRPPHAHTLSPVYSYIHCA